ncbi:hypothetical protein C8F04DRAFT_1093813 [Mycena alexandri]|uniref:Uncharacterized protein n=1 Tax=Mycena alexandri TaxID=1745969 RepID=A0AAD6X2U6_9AGAR|nr:hypothetical protein C8F04DRAFT_1093813 [Mycena alexandri]
MIEGAWDPIIIDQEVTLIMDDGWIRVNSAKVADTYRRQIYADWPARRSWMAQARHIFNRPNMTSNFEDYVFVDTVDYLLKLSKRGEDLPQGYLFLCPLDDLQSDSLASFRTPDCPAYWSLDPSGVERLSAEEEKNHEFPEFEFTMNLRGRSWDDRVYTGIRQFHEAKGFDPYGQEFGLEVENSLYQVSNDQETPFGHVEEDDTGDDYSGANKYYSDGEDQEYAVDSPSDSESSEGSNRNDLSECEDVIPRNEHSDGNRKHNEVEASSRKTTSQVELSSSESKADFNPNSEAATVRVEDIPECPRLEELQFFTPSQTWNIIMFVQLSLMILLGTFSLLARVTPLLQGTTDATE